MTQSDPPPPLDYAPPTPRADRPGPSGAVTVGLFILGLIVGPILLGCLIGAGGGMTNSGIGALAGAFVYVALMVWATVMKGTRGLGLGMLCGPLIVVFAIAVICGTMKI